MSPTPTRRLTLVPSGLACRSLTLTPNLTLTLTLTLNPATSSSPTSPHPCFRAPTLLGLSTQSGGRSTTPCSNPNPNPNPNSNPNSTPTPNPNPNPDPDPDRNPNPNQADDILYPPHEDIRGRVDPATGFSADLKYLPGEKPLRPVKLD